MDGNLSAGYDVDIDFVDTWNTMLTSNDFINANTGLFDVSGSQWMISGNLLTSLSIAQAHVRDIEPGRLPLAGDQEWY